MRIESLDQSRLLISDRLRPILEHHGLLTLDQVMALEGGQVRRDFPGRQTVRLELTDAAGASEVVYLKRYLPGYLSIGKRLLRQMGWPGARDEASQEWNALLKLRALGLPTAEPLAMGGDPSADRAVSRSFVMTAELRHAREAHQVASTLSASDRRGLLCAVAALARKFHATGMVHKDFYLSHFMVRPGPPWELFLIDLQRAVRPRLFPERWLVKDLAALVYSALKAGAQRSDIVAGFRTYRAGARLSARDRRIARKVQARVAWLKTRRPKHDKDFQQLA